MMWSPALRPTRPWPSSAQIWRKLWTARGVRPRRVAAVASNPRLSGGERILLHDRDTDGAPVVATDRALYHRPGDGWRRLGWEQAVRVGWDRTGHILTLTGLPPGAPARTVLRLTGATRLPELARERVTATTLAAAQVPLDGRHCAVVTARRRPGSDDLLWAVAVSPGADPDDPRVRAEVDRAIATLRADLGL